MTEPPAAAQPHPASFRDPDSRVFTNNGRIFRVLSKRAADEFLALCESGLIPALVGESRLIESKEATAAEAGVGEIEDGGLVLEHPRLAFISYPYEWPFAALQRAAVFHLEVHATALKAGATLSDATAYNVQFQGTRPLFVDVTSLRRYREGELWAGHRQFCEQFLNPLLLQAHTGVAYQAWYRGAMEGIPAESLAPLLPLLARSSWLVLSHVMLQRRLQQSASHKSTEELRALPSRGLPLRNQIAMIEQLRDGIAKLRPKGAGKSTWSDYETTRNYDDEGRRLKAAAVAEFTAAVQPRMMVDLGCNAGEYSLIAHRSGAEFVVGFDADTVALDHAFRRSLEEKARFLPLYFDAANPSPSQGWRQMERQGFQERARFDAALALAFEHHLIVARNVPIPSFLDWLLGIAPRGLVEFVEKEDATIQKMLAIRGDIFSDYTRENFERALAARVRIVKVYPLGRNERSLYWYER